MSVQQTRSVPQTRIFGLKVGLDPKILVIGLIAVAAILFWYNSRGDDETGTSSNGGNRTAPAPIATAPSVIHKAPVRTTNSRNNNDVLRFQAVDATRGDIDPTLRLDLLESLRSQGETPAGRNLFVSGPAPEAVAAAKVAAIKAPIIPVKPLPVVAAPPAPSGPPPLNIPLKYYGYSSASGRGTPNSGFFLDGDDVLVAAEGQTVKQRYLVVELTANSARLEDVQLRQGQTLPVTPLYTATQ